MPNKLDPVIEKFISALDQSAGGIRGTLLELKIISVLIRWLDKNIIDIVRAIQANLSDKKRKEFWFDLIAGYCTACARKLESGGKCHCENDE